MTDKANVPKHYLLASDFDQTLSFNDSGVILSELLGRSGFEEKVAGLARTNLVQQGGELAYLILHDPEYRCVRKEHLVEVGKRIPLKQNIKLLIQFLANGIEGHSFSFYVISAAPEEVVKSALEGVVPPDHIYATRFNYDPATGETQSIARVPAGYGKVAVLEELQSKLQISPDRIVYVGDGSSDIHVMLHVNRRDGFTIAVSENKYIGPIAKRSVLSDDALSVLVPILEDIVGWKDPARIRALFEPQGLHIQEWEKVQTDILTIRQSPATSQRKWLSTWRPLVSEWIGWLATAIFASSYFCKQPATLRRLQALAALLWMGYSIIIKAAPVVFANTVVAVLAIYSSWRQPAESRGE